MTAQKSSSLARMSAVSPETSYTPAVSSTGMSYRPFLELGEGGMAKIFLARAIGPSGFNKLVVLKSMRQNLLEDEALRQMFVDEARLSARFNHPNLVQVQEVNPTAEPPYLVMEFLDGKPMSGVRDNEIFTLGMRLCVISEVLNGLHYAHELSHFDGSPLGIVHRDVSPQNVFITYDGAVKVLDFGIAKMVSNASRTEAGEVKGKLMYMAPEQLLGSEIDRRADVFSVGSLLWEAAIGKRMWEGVAEATIMHRLVSGEIPRPSEHGAIDPELEDIIVKATAPEADDRFATARALQVELDGYIARAGEHRSLRQIGADLALAFQDERRRNAEIINVALRASVRPPPAPDAPEALDPLQAAAELEEEPRPHSRAPLLLGGALVLLAVVGFLAPRIWREPASVAPDPGALDTVPRAAVPAAAGGPRAPGVGEIKPAEPALATETDSSTAESASASASAAPSASAKDRKKGALRQAGPAAAAAAAPSPPAPARPAADDHCSPPYYFVGGIKTYKPECL
jgi:eukaryotic-like serine/threonine-protein kinase